MIAVFGSKGGVGKTTVALNLAVILARTKGRKVTLLELNDDGGSLAAHLGLEATPNFASLLPQVEELEPGALAKKLLAHRTGIKLLFSPQKPRVKETPVGNIERLVHLLTYTQDYVVVDCQQHLSPWTMALLDLAQLIILVTTGDLIALQSTAAMLSALSGEGFPLGKIQVIVNRFCSFSPPKDQISKILPVGILGFLPEEPSPLAAAKTSGIPLVSNTKCSLVQALESVEGQLHKFIGQAGNPPSRLWPGQKKEQPTTSKEQWRAMKQIVQQKLLDDLSREQLVGEQLEAYASSPQMAQKVKRLVEGLSLPGEAQMADEITSHLFGLGPLDPFLADDSISEIMVNGPGPVYIERHGIIECTECILPAAEEIIKLIQRIASRLGRRIDESSPMVDARLADGSRVNAVLPPIALGGPILTIRKFSSQCFTMEQLMELGSLSQHMADFLKLCIEARCNIIVAGGASSGKTTTLGALSVFIEPRERIITIEDAAELRLHQSHVVALEARPANVEGKGEISIRQLVRNALRMRPDRIIVGEVRGDEVMDMVQAMNTGHSGSLSTVHANSPRELLTRLEGMMLMASPSLPLISVREQLAAAVNIIIYQRRFPDGSRKLTQVSEVLGIEKKQIKLQDLFQYQEGEFAATGQKPKFAAELSKHGAEFEKLFVTG